MPAGSGNGGQKGSLFISTAVDGDHAVRVWQVPLTCTGRPWQGNSNAPSCLPPMSSPSKDPVRSGVIPERDRTAGFNSHWSISVPYPGILNCPGYPGHSGDIAVVVSGWVL